MNQPAQIIIGNPLLLSTAYPAIKLARRDERQLNFCLRQLHLVTPPFVYPDGVIDACLSGVLHRQPVFKALTPATIHFREQCVAGIARQR